MLLLFTLKRHEEEEEEERPFCLECPHRRVQKYQQTEEDKELQWTGKCIYVAAGAFGCALHSYAWAVFRIKHFPCSVSHRLNVSSPANREAV